MQKIEALLRLQEKKREYEKYQEMSENTFKTYFRAISALISKLDGLPDTLEDAYDVVLEIYDKPRTINTFRYALEWFYGKKLGRKKIKEPRPDVKVIEHDDVLCILNTMLNEGDEYYACLTAMFYFLAMRLNEALALRVGDVDIDKSLTVTVFTEKSEDPYIVPIARSAIKYIAPYYRKAARNKRKRDLLFERNGKLPSDRVIIHHLNRYARACGIDEHITPHTFRRSRATYMLEKGMPDSVIRNVLRQTSAQALMHYTKVNPETVRRFIDDIDDNNESLEGDDYE